MFTFNKDLWDEAIEKGLQGPSRSREWTKAADTAVYCIMCAQAENDIELVNRLSCNLRSKCIAADKEWVYMKVAVDLSRWHNITIPQ